jgi:hypothetical protein
MDPNGRGIGAKMYVEAIFSPLIIVGRGQARKILPATKKR